MRRSLQTLLVTLVVVTSSGVLPAAAAGLRGEECCDSPCQDEAPADPACPDHEGSSDCPPLCSACMCGTFFAPAIPRHVEPLALAAPAVRPAGLPTRCQPPSQPGRGIFHPPRLLS